MFNPAVNSGLVLQPAHRWQFVSHPNNIVWIKCVLAVKCCRDIILPINVEVLRFAKMYINVLFYPRPVLAFGYLSLPPSVSPSVTKFVRAITHHPFKLGSPNLDHRCKRPWLRSLLFLGWLTMTFKVKFNFKVKIYPIFELVRAITHHPFKLGQPNLDQRC